MYIARFTKHLMGTYKSVLQKRCSGNFHRTEMIVTTKFQGLRQQRPQLTTPYQSDLENWYISGSSSV